MKRLELIASLTSVLLLRSPGVVHLGTPLGPAREGTISGVVRLPGGKVPDKTQVTVLSKQSFLGIPMFSSGSLADPGTGRFRIENVPAGSYLLAARYEPGKDLTIPPAYEGKELSPPESPIWWAFRSDLAPGTSELTLDLTPGSKQAFVAKTGSGVRIEDLNVLLALKSASDWKPPTDAGAEPIVEVRRRFKPVDGAFVVDGLARGEWTGVFSIPEYGRTGEVSFTIPTEKPPRISIPKFLTIRGRVQAPEGASVDKVWVGIEYDRTYAMAFEDGQVATYTDATGHFVIESVRPARCRLKASAGMDEFGYASELTLEEGHDLNDVEIELVAKKK